jgi:hypothetical protein
MRSAARIYGIVPAVDKLDAKEFTISTLHSDMGRERAAEASDR